VTIKHWYIGFAVVTLASCGGGGDSNGPAPPPVGNTPVPEGGITVRNNSYSPSAKTIAAGGSVEWAWNSCTGGYEGETCIAHSVTFADGVTSPIQERGTYTRTFATAGTYDYHCLTHGAAMSGRVTVQ
jgi:plastocyanin